MQRPHCCEAYDLTYHYGLFDLTYHYGLLSNELIVGANFGNGFFMPYVIFICILCNYRGLIG